MDCGGQGIERHANMVVHGMGMSHMHCHHSAGAYVDAVAEDGACHTNKQEQSGSLAPLLPPQYRTSDGSLNDILQLPFEYHDIFEGNQPYYNALLNIEHEKPLMNMQQPSNHILPTPPHQQSPHQQLISPANIMSFIYDTHTTALPPLAPAAPPHNTRRPPLRKGTTSYREAHIQSERQRRQEMAQAFKRLRSLLPNVQENDLQEDRCTILGQVIKYVQDLDKKVQDLGKVKTQLMQEHDKNKVKKKEEILKNISNYTSNVSVRQWGNFDIFITLNCPKQRGLWPNLLALLQDTLQLDVQNVALSSTPFFCVHSIYAKVAPTKEQQVSCKMLQERLGSFVATHTYDNIWH